MLARTQKGFTLLELIVVIVILGILAAVSIPTFASVIAKSKYATLRESAQSFANNTVALAAYDGVVPANNSSYVSTAISELSGYTAAPGTASNAVTVTRTSDGMQACVSLASVVNGASSVAAAAGACA